MRNLFILFCSLIITLTINKTVNAQCVNVALGKPATASNYAVWANNATPDEANDGDCNSAWNAGTYAPQYWQVDLLSTYTINNINIMFDMSPNGYVYHQILTSPDMINWIIIDSMVGNYYNGQLYERCYSSSPLTNVRGIRINTLISPSWVAIRDLGVYTLSTQTSPTISASGSLTLCQGDSVTLTSSAAGTYSWSNGATTQSITVGASGTYTVTTNAVPICVQGTLPCTSCGYGTASATVIVNPHPTVNLGNDTTLTQGNTVTLNAGNAGSTYLWSTGATTQTINVTAIGTYWVKLTNAGGCYNMDTINVTIPSINTNASGIINIYTKVTAFNGCNSITVASTTGYNVGDTVLIIQMKGATIDTSNTAAFGNILNYNEAGNYEFNIIKSISGNIIKLKNVLIKSYNPSGFVQLIRVPSYNDLTITGTLTAKPWDGNTGGVLVFEASGTITLNGDIDVSGLGFRGGIASTINDGSFDCNFLDYFYTLSSGLSGKKGEGILDNSLALECGRGALANGGGGGNCHNAGGAGGGNYGSGGRGGDQFYGCDSIPIGGDGGRSLLYSNAQNKIFLGGGGGGPHQNNGMGTNGTNGGGLIIVNANTLVGNGYDIKSNGNDNLAIAGGDGSGGGGAGGTILLDISNFITPINIQGRGGNGGSNNWVSCHPPGGGGSGGAVWLSGSSLSSNISYSLYGGFPGNSSCTNIHYGAELGAIGGIVYNLQLVQSNTPDSLAVFVNLGNDTTLSQGSSLNLNAGNTGATYQWSTGDTTQQINITTTETYWVKVTNAGGCYSMDTINVNVIPFTFNIGNDTTICKGSSITFKANAPSTTGTWEYNQDFENTISSEWSDTNRITYNNTKELGAYGSQTINLNLSNLPIHDSVEVSFDLYIYDSWDGNNPGWADFWSLKINNITQINTTFTNMVGTDQSYPQNYPASYPDRTGAYLINLPNRCHTCNCFTSSLYKIVRKISDNNSSLQIGFAGNLTQDVCDEGWGVDNVKIKLLNVDSITTNYLWSTGDTTQTITVTPAQTTTYIVTVTKGTTVYKDTATVYVMNPQVNLVSDTTICKGDSVKLIPTIITNTNLCSKSQLPTNLQQGLVAFYPFCGNANDESGNGNDGTSIGATLTSDRFGNPNCAYNFDGASHYININPIDTNTFPKNNANRSVSLWAKINTGGQLFYWGDDIINQTGNAFDLDLTSIGFSFDGCWDNGSLNYSLNPQVWYHICITYDGNTSMKCYLNGTYIGNIDVPQVLQTASFGHNTIGTKFDRFNNIQNPFYGSIDDVVIYNRVLSATEVNQLYTLGTPSSLSCHWSTGDTTQTITVSPNQTTNYSVSVTNSTGCSASDTITVNVIPLPVVNLGNDTTICKGDSVLLNSGLTVGNTLFCDKSILPANLQQGLVAFYPFCGNANDESGNGNNGTVNGATLTTDRFGNANSAYSFDGTSNYIETLYGGPLGDSSRTFSFWSKTTQNSLMAVVSYSCTIPYPAGGRFEVSLNYGGCLGLSVDVCSGVNTKQVITNDNQWSFYTVTFDRQSSPYLSSIKYYKNGTIINNYCFQWSGIDPIINTVSITPLNIGRLNLAGDYRFFNGVLDDIYIYNRVLSALEVSQLYSLGNVATCHWSTGDTTQTIKVSPNQTTTYSLNVTNSNGCSASDSIKVNVAPLPIVNLGNDTSLCQGNTLNLNAANTVSTYLWQDNSTNQIYNVNQQGTYWVKVTTPIGCTGSDTINVNYNPATVVNLGNDTTICQGETLLLDASLPNATYLWQDGSTNATFNVSVQGTYWVKVTNSNGCSGTDTIHVTLTPLVVNIGNDTTICQGNTVTLNAGNTGASYVWSTSETTQQISVNSSGAYWVKVSNGNCFNSDTINVNVIPKPIVNLGNDTTICHIGSFTLNAGNAGSIYLWSTNATTQQINVSTTGSYWVKVNNNGCIGGDTISVAFIPLNVNIGNDTTICEGDNLTLNAGNSGSIYLWNTGVSTQTINVGNAGNYWVNVTNGNCTGSDTININVAQKPIVNLGNDTIMCPGDLVVLSAGAGFSSYLWSDGSTQPTLNVNNPGTYTVTVSNSGCKATDQIVIAECNSDIWVPNVFTPNGDGKNDTFHPVCTNITDISMYIYNRWGNQIYEGTGATLEWDGKYKGEICPEGVYYYLIDYTQKSNNHTTQKQLHGSITLLK